VQQWFSVWVQTTVLCCISWLRSASVIPLECTWVLEHLTSGVSRCWRQRHVCDTHFDLAIRHHTHAHTCLSKALDHPMVYQRCGALTLDSMDKYNSVHSVVDHASHAADDAWPMGVCSPCAELLVTTNPCWVKTFVCNTAYKIVVYLHMDTIFHMYLHMKCVGWVVLRPTW